MQNEAPLRISGRAVVRRHLVDGGLVIPETSRLDSGRSSEHSRDLQLLTGLAAGHLRELHPNTSQTGHFRNGKPQR